MDVDSVCDECIRCAESAAGKARSRAEVYMRADDVAGPPSDNSGQALQKETNCTAVSFLYRRNFVTKLGQSARQLATEGADPSAKS